MRYRFDDVEVDRSIFKVTRGGRTIALQPKMFELLCYLIEHRDRTVPREELLEALWSGEHVTHGVVAWTVSHVRKALGSAASRRYPIETVHGRGYRFTAPIEQRRAPQPERSQALAVAAGPKRATPFVGRDVAMRRLDQALIGALQGQGRLCVLHGEAGIGKTRCARELLYRAQELDVSTLWGGTVEGGGAPVFWPWLQILRQIAEAWPAREAQALDLHAQLSSLDVRAERAPSEGTDRRFWLYEQLWSLLLSCSREQTAVVFIDDLQWADEGTLGALQFLAPELSDARLLLLATQREPSDPAGDFAVRTRFARLAEHVELGRLAREDIARYVASWVEDTAHVPPELVDAIYLATAGNPLFVEETLRSLHAEHGRAGLLDVSPKDIRPPAVARDVLRLRWQQLPADHGTLLSQASVLGEEFDLMLLQAVSQRPTQEVISTLQDAAERSFIVANGPHRYRFSHALHRGVLYEAMPSAERVEAHRRAAHCLEAHEMLERREAEIAQHYYRSLPAGDFPAVVRAACRAAQAAERAAAYADAAGFYSWALEAQALDSESEPRARAELLLAAGIAHRRAGSDRASRDLLKRMLELAHQHEYADLLFRGASVLRPTFVLGTIPDSLARNALEQVLRCVPDGPHPLRIQALAHLAWLPPCSTDMASSKQMCGNALALARKLGSREPLLAALRAGFYALSGPDDVDALLELAAEMLDLDASRPGRPSTEAYAAQAGALFYRGDVDGAVRAIEMCGRIAQERHFVEVQWYHMRQRAQRYFMDGHFELAERACDELESRSDRLGLSYGRAFVDALRHSIAVEREGAEPVRDEAWFSTISTGALSMPVGARARRVRSAAEAGFLDVARAGLASMAAGEFECLPKETGYLGNLAHLALATLVLPGHPYAKKLYELLEPYPFHNTPDLFLRYEGSVSRYLALLAEALGWRARAREHFEDALEMNARIRHVAILARTRLEYAEWLATHGEAGDERKAREQASAAVHLGERLGMGWLVQRARAL